MTLVAAEASELEMPPIISRESCFLLDDMQVEAGKKGRSSASNTSVGDCLHNAVNPKYEETNFKSTFLCRNVSKTFGFFQLLAHCTTHSLSLGIQCQIFQFYSKSSHRSLGSPKLAYYTACFSNSPLHSLSKEKSLQRSLFREAV